MEIISDILSIIGDFEEIIERFKDFAIEYRILAIILFIPLSAVIFYTFFERTIDFISKVKSNTNSRKDKLTLITVLFISAIFSILLVDNIVEANTVRPIFLDREGNVIDSKENKLQPTNLIGEKLSLQWQYDNENKLRTNKKRDFRYSIEFSEDVNFAKPKLYDLSDRNNIETEVDFNKSLYWRVTPGYATGKSKKPFKRLSLPSLPLLVSQYSSISNRIHQEKNIKICTSRTSERSFLSYLPKGQILSSTADPIGLEPELAKIVVRNIFLNLVKNQEINYEFIKPSWKTIFDDTSKGKCDMAISSISKTDEREQKYHLRFSEPYYQTSLALIANDKKYPATLQNNDSLIKILNGKKVGVLGNSTSQKTLEEFNAILHKQEDLPKTPGIIIETYPRVDKAFSDLLSTTPNIDFVLSDKVYTDSLLFKNNLTMVKELTPEVYPLDFPNSLIGENYGIAVNYTASDILDEINQTIKNLKRSKQLDSIIAEHRAKHNKLVREKYTALIGKPETETSTR